MGISNVTIGANSYVDFGGGNWMKVPTGFGGFFRANALNQALGYLRALSAFPDATLDGDVYTVHGVVSELPRALVTLLFTQVRSTRMGSGQR